MDDVESVVLVTLTIPELTRLLVTTFAVAAIPVRLAPDPLKLVAVITPVTFTPPAPVIAAPTGTEHRKG